MDAAVCVVGDRKDVVFVFGGTAHGARAAAHNLAGSEPAAPERQGLHAFIYARGFCNPAICVRKVHSRTK
eukprot:339752-Heterocapsa_arctica.AAC.1